MIVSIVLLSFSTHIWKDIRYTIMFVRGTVTTERNETLNNNSFIFTSLIFSYWHFFLPHFSKFGESSLFKLVSFDHHHQKKKKESFSLSFMFFLSEIFFSLVFLKQLFWNFYQNYDCCSIFNRLQIVIFTSWMFLSKY